MVIAKRKKSFFLGGAVITFLGSFLFTILGLLIPLRPYTEPELQLMVDHDCACFIGLTCFFSLFLMGLTLICFVLGKNELSKNKMVKVVCLFWLIITLTRMFYVLPYC